MRRRIVAGNWKMNMLSTDAFQLLDEIENGLITDCVQVIIFPPAIFTRELAIQKKHIHVGMQNFYPENEGAFTGEISIRQLVDTGATHVLIGHSERRLLFFESPEIIKRKVDVAIANGITPIFCCGEVLDIRENGDELNYVKKQLTDSLFHLPKELIQRVIIAYEPVWAIGTGKTASVVEAEQMLKAIRSWLHEYYGNELAESVSILYGGSCNASNASELFACPNVDGGLIGGASLKSASFLQIIQSF